MLPASRALAGAHPGTLALRRPGVRLGRARRDRRHVRAHPPERVVVTAPEVTVAHLLPGGGELLPTVSLNLAQRVLDHPGSRDDVTALARRLVDAAAALLTAPCPATAARERALHQLATGALSRVQRRRRDPSGRTPVQSAAETVAVVHGFSLRADDVRGDLLAARVENAVDIYTAAAQRRAS